MSEKSQHEQVVETLSAAGRFDLARAYLADVEEKQEAAEQEARESDMNTLIRREAGHEPAS